MTHTCVTEPTEGELLCSRFASARVLTGMGFPVKLVQKVLGTPYTVVEGKTVEAARHDAWVAGKLRLCTRLN